MIFEDLSTKTCCPYNKNHVFEKQKLIFHLNRCKDRERVGHLYSSCQYNRIHIVLKEDLSTHEMFCPDQQELKNLTSQLMETLNQVERQRERSREKVKKEELKCQTKNQIKVQCASDHVVLENCPLCQGMIQKLEEMKKIAPENIMLKIKMVEKMIKMNNQFIKAEEELQNRQSQK